jgi:ElaA protein
VNASDAQPNRAAPPADADVRLLTFEALGVGRLHALLRLRGEVFVVEQACAYADIDGADPQALHLLVEREGELLAYARLLPPSAVADSVSLGRFVVAPQARGRGLGRWLIELATACAQERWPGTTLQLSAQHHLQALYASCGYRAVGTPYDEDGILHVKMVCPATGD